MTSNEVSLIVQKMTPSFGQALPKHFSAEKYTRIALTAIRKNPKLAQCDQASLLGSLMMFAQLGLEPNTPLGHAYLVPFRNKGQYEVTPIIGYKGALDLAYRTGLYEVIDAHPVYSSDEFDYAYGFDEFLKHKPQGKRDGKPTHYYAFYKLKGGGRRFRVWTHDECIAHGKKYSKSFANGPWSTNEKAMCLKTVIKDLLSYAPMSAEEKQTWSIANMEGGIVKASIENPQEIEATFENPKLIEAENKSEEKKLNETNEQLKELGL